MKLDYLEIGTSDFHTEVEQNDGIGISIDPLQIYLDRLPNKDNNIKVCCAIGDYIGKTKVFYIHPNDIEKYDLPFWIRGCNSIVNPHTLAVEILKERKLEHIYRYEECDIITWHKLLSDYDITEIDFLKIDTEGYDLVIIEQILSSDKNVLPKKLTFETNSITDPLLLDKTISMLQNRGYQFLEKGYDTSTFILNN